MIREKDIQVHLPKSSVKANQNLCGRRGADETEKKYGFGYHSRKVKIIFFPNKGRKKRTEIQPKFHLDQNYKAGRREKTTART